MKNPPCHCCGGTGVENDHARIGNGLKLQRIAAGLPLFFVAAKLGIKPSTLCDLEHGRRYWTQERIEQYREIVNK